MSRAVSATDSRIGLVWRPIEAADLPAIVDLLAAAGAVDHTEQHFNLDDVSHLYANPQIDPGQDSLLAASPEGVAAASIVVSAGDAQGTFRASFLGTVRPGARGRGIGRELLDWSLARGTALHRERAPQLPGAVDHAVFEGNDGWESLCRAAGLTAVRWFVEMQRPLAGPTPKAPLPDGVRIEGYPQSYDDAVLAVRNEAFTTHWGSLQRSPEEWARLTGSETFRRDLSLIAIHGDDVVGFLTAFVYPAATKASGIPETWVRSVGTSTNHRGRGIASALLARAIELHAAAGFERIGLEVDVDNTTGALRLYQRLGFIVARRVAAWALELPALR